MPKAETIYGQVRGTESGGIQSFRGLPFAAPLTGERRFLPPVAPEPWRGVRDATQRGHAAPQYSLPWFSWLNAAAGAQGEDCLSLNLWTPGTDGSRPVLVWIHGGGFLVGSGSTPLYNGAAMAAQGDLVVVTINYRLGALGYAHLGLLLGDEFAESSNLGVRDQIAALEWVRDNIEHFGGDPDNVTVFGQSAGAMSIAALLGAPRARKLIRRAICQSGAADHVLEADRARHVASTFIQTLGEPHPTLRKLGEMPIDTILRAQHETMLGLVDLRQLMVFLPVVDGDLIPEQPLAAVRRGATADIPLLIGTTLDEWKLFRFIDQGPFQMSEEELLSRFEESIQGIGDGDFEARSAVGELRAALADRDEPTTPGDVWTAFQSARIMHFPASKLADAQHAAGGQTHAYLFKWRPPVMSRALGACHALDVPFVFGSIRHPLARPLTGFTASAPRLSRNMQQCWIGFARQGDPDHAWLPSWATYSSGNRTTMIFDRRCSLQDAPLDAERRLLEKWSAADSDDKRRVQRNP